MSSNLLNPTANTNYLLSDQILVGWYPCADSSEPDADELFTCNNITSILKTNRNIFVNLTTKIEKKKLHKYMDQVVNAVSNPIFIHYEIDDHNIPVDNVGFNSFIDMLYELYQKSENRFYIHCAGGHGRTGLVCGCLLKRAGYTSSQALELVTQWHKTRDNMPDYPSPENSLQIQYVKDYPNQ